jgi:hypothetical protein
MGLFGHKGPEADKPDRSKPHDYKAPAQPPSSGRVACQICGQGPEDILHGSQKVEIESPIHWS